MTKGGQVEEFREALVRVLAGQDSRTVATEMGLSESRLREIADSVIDPGVVKEHLVRMALGLECDGEPECRLANLEIPGKSYTPDCVWWNRPRGDGKIRALFEIDKDVSPKHYAGGVALANVVALMTGTVIPFFSIVPFKHRGRAERTLQLFERHLGDKWACPGVKVAGLLHLSRQPDLPHHAARHHHGHSSSP
jgi:hypothetical protein